MLSLSVVTQESVSNRKKEDEENEKGGEKDRAQKEKEILSQLCSEYVERHAVYCSAWGENSILDLLDHGQ